jgi:hypothetical protein
MKKEISIREFIQNYRDGRYNSHDPETMIAAGWYDCFCRETSLKPKLDKLFPKVVQVALSGKIDIDKSYVFFKNNCLCWRNSTTD